MGVLSHVRVAMACFAGGPSYFQSAPLKVKLNLPQRKRHTQNQIVSSLESSAIYYIHTYVIAFGREVLA